MQKYQVVCVDDKEDILELYQDIFSKSEHEIVTFSDPVKAISHIRINVNQVIMIFSDYSMPDMDGLEFRKELNIFASEIPFALITGFYNKEMAVKGMELKICSFLEKPFNEEELQALLLENSKLRINSLNEDREMVTSFVEESFPMIEEIEDLILILEGDPSNSDALNTYFRLLHTIKGTASCVGLKSLPAYAHKYEDLVGDIKSGKLVVSRAVIDVFLKGLDYLKFMYSEIQAGNQFEFEIDEAVKIYDQDFSKFEAVVAKEVTKEELAVGSEPSKKSDDDKINVSVGILDSFMELSGELTVIRNMIVKSAEKLEQKYLGDRDIEVLSEALSEMHKVSSVLQSEISEMRKISLDSIYRPMKRVVRDACKSMGKDIDFQTNGHELRLDTSIGKVLSNALIHLVRNGVDHGVETPEVREANGKTSQGTIILNGYEEGENIIVEIKDDGNGMDPEVLKRKAIEKELYTEAELDKMSPNRIFSLIFESGFSTAATVTDISGRGVGMDMVRNSVENVGGKIIIDSEKGKGSTFVMIIPIPRSVLIIKALMIEVNKLQLSIPLDDVAEVVSLENNVEQKLLKRIEGTILFNHHEDLIPLLSLSEILGLGKLGDKNYYDIVVVKGESYRYGLIVDTIHDIEEVVAKKLAKQINPDGCFLGATLVGDGEMALILDLMGIATKCEIKVEAEQDLSSFFKSGEEESDDIEFMQFDLATHKNFAISLDHVNRLEEFSSSSVEFSGDVPLVRYRDKFLPLVFLESHLDLCKQRPQDIIKEVDTLKSIVVSYEDKHYGFIVNKIQEIGKTNDKLSTLNKDREGVEGTVFIEEKTYTVINPLYLIDNFRAKSHSISGQKYKLEITKESAA